MTAEPSSAGPQPSGESMAHARQSLDATERIAID